MKVSISQQRAMPIGAELWGVTSAGQVRRVRKAQSGYGFTWVLTSGARAGKRGERTRYFTTVDAARGFALPLVQAARERLDRIVRENAAAA